MKEQYLDILKTYWGFDSFRGIQEDIVHSIGEGRDTLGLMPTGGGKSITFQVPALAREGICIVITPLIALMKDQVHHLREKGIKATAIYSGLRQNEIITILENCIFGNYKFLYISPERLSTDIFKAKLKSMNVSMIAVDEAHCISQWGYDFRPSYLKISEIRKMLPDVPVLALTATATEEVIDDIQEKLMFREKNVFRMSFYRKNIAYIVRRTDDKINEMLKILSKVPGAAIIYVRSRIKTKEVCDILLKEGITAEYYHAGLSGEVKDEKQKKWMKDESRVMVATNAFGMGIDKPDVRLVIHIDVPDSVEAYFQEAGRAGRDGMKSYAVMLFNNNDKRNLNRRVPEAFPDKEYIRDVYEHLSYYYQIGMGSGNGAMFEFNLVDFSMKFKHRAVLVDSSLKILTQAGYLEYTEEQDTNSRVMLLVSRDEIENYTRNDKTIAGVMETIMRSYTGLYSDYSFIDESLIAYKCNIQQRTVYEVLKELSYSRIISYVPHKKTRYIIYNTNRLEKESLRFYDNIYKDKKERFAKRINAILDYCTDEHSCRSRILLNYFGEKHLQNCMMCDVCLQRTATPMRFGELDNLVNRTIRYLRENGDVHPRTLLKAISDDDKKAGAVITYMADMEMIIPHETTVGLTDKYKKNAESD